MLVQPVRSGVAPLILTMALSAQCPSFQDHSKTAMSDGMPSAASVSPSDVQRASELGDVLLESRGIELGVVWHVGKTASDTRTLTQTFTSTDEFADTHFREESYSRTTSQHIAGNLQGGFKGGKFSLDGGASYDGSELVTTTYVDKHTTQEKDTKSKEIKDVNERVEKNTASYGEQDGYIRTGIVLTNLTADEITVSDISYDVVDSEQCPVTLARTDSLGSGVIRQAELRNGTIQPGEAPPDAKNDSIASIKIPGLKTSSYSVFLPHLVSSLVLNTITDHRTVQLKINSFKLSRNGATILVAPGERVPVSAIGVNILDSAGEIRRYYVSLGHGPLTLKAALAQIAPGATFATSNGESVIDTLLGRKASFHELEQGKEPPPNTDGTWVVSASSYQWGGLDDAVAGGSMFIVAWIPSAQLRTDKYDFSFPRSGVETEHPQAAKRYASSSGLIPFTCVHHIRVGDAIHVRMEGHTHQSTSVRTVQPSSECAAWNNTLKETDTGVDGHTGLTAFNLFVAVDIDNPNRQLVPISEMIPPCAVHYYIAGDVSYTINITSDNVPTDGDLCFYTPIQDVTLLQGREVLPLPFMDQNCTIWQSKDVDKKVSRSNYNGLHLIVSVQHSR